MLTAWDQKSGTTLALPDYEGRDELERVRERARVEELVCPTCQALLWLRAGEVLAPHFAHRRLNDCPHGRVSESVLAARRLIYRFFQTRIADGKLPGKVELEPVIPGLPKGVAVDLVIRREGKSSVAVVLIQSGLKPELRRRMKFSLERNHRSFRPVFLATRLLSMDEEAARDENGFRLDTTQRDFLRESPYDQSRCFTKHSPGTLHFIDPAADRWITLRGLTMAHHPQGFRPAWVRTSAMDQLLWSEAHAEWVHPGEAESLRQLRREEREIERKQREAEAEARRREREWRNNTRNRPSIPQAPPPQPSPREGRISGLDEPADPPVPDAKPEPEPVPIWLSEGLLCIGCGKRTRQWQTGFPGRDRCVCRDCFAAGVRMD